MKTNSNELKLLFSDTFTTETNGLPGGWSVEQNTDMPQVPAIQCGECCVELLSAGNKYLPIIPDTADCRIDLTAKINYAAAEQFGFSICFRYDVVSKRGQYVRFLNPRGTSEIKVEYGTTARNTFFPKESISFQADIALFSRKMEYSMLVQGDALLVTLPDKQRAAFNVAKGTGKVALCREHFWDVLKITRMDIFGKQPLKAEKKASFTVPLPDAPTWYPIFCDVTLTDYGNCLDADLSFHGGVSETPLGEGNYHGLRTDMLERPYLKIITSDETDKHVLYGKTLVLIPPGQTPKYLYKVVYEKPSWPFQQKVRFMKPEGTFDLAVGFENYHHNTLPDLEMSHAETIFTQQGKVLYSGASPEEKESCVIQFQSQPDKEIIRRLHKDDPRHEMAVTFAQRNHYFMEGEQADFTISLRSGGELPASYEVILEDAFLRKVRSLDFTLKLEEPRLGVRRIHSADLKVAPLRSLPCGVWHLRVRSTDPSVPPTEEYCAFEVMSRKKDALPPPLLSGLPFLYDSRTETRGLMTDAFDPWKNAQMNNGHYISCANFLPPAARKYHVYPTTRAYGRQNFAWIGSRCLDDWSIEGNMDLIKEADYINITEYLSAWSLTWSYTYAGERLRVLIKLLEKLKDPDLDLDAMRKVLKEKKKLSPDILLKILPKYWEEWQDAINKANRENSLKILKKLNKVNPRLKLAQYGPFHIYGAHLKGPEALRMVCNEQITPDINAFWQYEDYPTSCGYCLERGLYQLVSCLMVLPGSRIYPEIYTGGRLKQGCPDGAVFYAHPPFGFSNKSRSSLSLKRQIANFTFASGHLMADGFHFWENKGFQACRFTRRWYESILQVWPYVLEHPAVRPLRSPAYVSSEASRRANKEVIVEPYLEGRIIDIRKTATEDVPYIYEMAAKAGVCAGFQLFDHNLEKLTPDQVDTLVLPPLNGFSAKSLKKIRELHQAGVNLVACENVKGLEDIFGVRDTGIKKAIARIRATGDFCKGMSEYCDDERCRGSYVADGAEVLLDAEIPVLTIRHNAKASAAFFNVPPHLVKEECLRQKVAYGRTGISRLMEKATGDLMRSFSQTGVRISAGHLIGCHTKDGAILVIVANPDDEHEIPVQITLAKKAGFAGMPEANLPLALLQENRQERTLRVLLPKGELLFMLFRPGK